MCRLALVDIVGIELVVRTNRDINLFFRIPVEIPEVKRVRPIGIHFPPLERRAYILPTGVSDLILGIEAGDDENTKTQ